MYILCGKCTAQKSQLVTHGIFLIQSYRRKKINKTIKLGSEKQNSKNRFTEEELGQHPTIIAEDPGGWQHMKYYSKIK